MARGDRSQKLRDRIKEYVREVAIEHGVTNTRVYPAAVSRAVGADQETVVPKLYELARAGDSKRWLHAFATVSCPGGEDEDDEHPVVDVDLDRAFPADGACNRHGEFEFDPGLAWVFFRPTVEAVSGRSKKN